MNGKAVKHFSIKGTTVMSARDIVHTINNQLTIVIGKASLLAQSADDQGIKTRCREIETAAQTISSLLNRMTIQE
jgi:nitrogen-specific signal transduction histidine kinase